MDGQPASKITGPPLVEIGYARVMCAGILLKGSGLSVRRVRVINFGTRTSSQECFPLYLQSSGGPLPLTNVIEDCIIESPGWHNARETTCIQGPIERNNLVRCELRKPGPYAAMAEIGRWPNGWDWMWKRWREGDESF